ncbi:MAG: hypothetical protein OXU78_02685 [Deltaproteobacteria bacterium]|nr:hypothetical protein [Deltaproteobacteria bacterium]MDD9872146.1 hypothetical protein [Deltaproteobacteria bacterium]
MEPTGKLTGAQVSTIIDGSIDLFLAFENGSSMTFNLGKQDAEELVKQMKVALQQPLPIPQMGQAADSVPPNQ